MKDIIEDHNLNATQLQKYYQLGRLYQNVPNKHKRRLTALKYDLEKKCKTRTMDTHINVIPFQIGRLLNNEFEEVLKGI